MSENSWGTKRVCQECGVRFYDFKKSPIKCPACGAHFDPEYLYKKKTKNYQEKSEDVEIIPIAIGDDALVSEPDDEITVLDDGDEISIESEKDS